ncbi:hypothetical protein [Streptomyces sp. WAC 06738]|uniref:hypothetical protein n=1 Tax=Streptomyces sp. WAC 06738 TaxID=2203210 RepID=UPI0013E048B4|nr:hypothetical protein [Streptomyces sp. WAC 06738]
MLLGFIVCPLIAALAAMALVVAAPRHDPGAYLLPAARIVAAVTLIVVAIAAAAHALS